MATTPQDTVHICYKMASQESDSDSFFALIRAQLQAKVKLQSELWDYDFLADLPADQHTRFQWECLHRASVSTRATNDVEEEELKSEELEIKPKIEEEETLTAIQILQFRFSDV